MQRCNQQISLPAPTEEKNTEACVFICHSRANRGSWQSEKSLFPIDMLHFKLCPEEPHPAYLHFASFTGLHSNGLSQVSWSQIWCPYVAFSSEQHHCFSNQWTYCFRASKGGSAQKEKDSPVSLHPWREEKVSLTLKHLKNVKVWTFIEGSYLNIHENISTDHEEVHPQVWTFKARFKFNLDNQTGSAPTKHQLRLHFGWKSDIRYQWNIS